MTNAEFYDLISKPDAMPVRLVVEHLWQFAAALKVCTGDAQLVALAVSNPRLAAEYATQQAVRDALDEPNPLHVAMAAATDDAERLRLLAHAPAHLRAEYADDLALTAYTQEQMCGQYSKLILGERS